MPTVHCSNPVLTGETPVSVAVDADTRTTNKEHAPDATQM